MKKEFTYLSADGITNIHAIEWKPEGEIKAILQIAHGMVEYIDRYDEFASYLCEKGYMVIGNDHLGHGLSVKDGTCYGYFHETRGNECVIADIHRLRSLTQKIYEDIPYFVLGHSMGSFLMRQYIELYGEGLKGAIIMGTGEQSPVVVGAGKTLCKIIAMFKGWKHRSELVDNMAFGSYNKGFEPARTEKDWLTKEEKVVDAYLANPWNTFRFTVNGYYHMFRGMMYASKKEHIQQIPKDLPLFLVAGDKDPVGENGKAVKKVYETYKACQIKDVRIKLYENDRHEILNETDRATVFEDIWMWLEEKR